MGERSCVDGKWSECLGTTTTQIYVPAPTPPGVHAQNLAPSSVSCMEVCDPYCQQLADTPTDLMVSSSFTADPSGLTLYSAGFTGGNCPDVGITPAMPTLTITAINSDGTVTPNTVPLSAGCGLAATPITPTWSTDQPDRSSVSTAGTLQVFSGIAASINVTASSVLDTATVPVNVNVNIKEEVAGISAATRTALDTAGAAADPGKTLYPYKNTVFPLDLKAPLVQWQTGGTAAANVQVALRYPAGSATPSFWYSKIYAADPMEGTLQTTGAPAWQVPQAVWTALGRTAPGQTAEIVIQRTAGTTYQEMIIPVTFSTTALNGTVYYTQYKRRLFGTTGCTGQTDLPAGYNPLSPGATICPVGNCTHLTDSGASTTRSIDLSSPSAVNGDPFGGAGGCPVCHSMSAQGNMYVAGSRFLEKYSGGTSSGFVDRISLSAMGAATFTTVGEAPNYQSLQTDPDDWNSRGFGYAPLTPDGALALQGYFSYGNTQDGTVGTTGATVVSRLQTDGGQTVPMFFVPTTNSGATVKWASTAALGGTLAGNVLTGAGGDIAPDGSILAVGDSVLLKNQASAVQNGIYVVTDPGGDITTSTTLTVARSSVNGTTNVAANAFDNNTSTRWESTQGVDPQWISVDLGSSKSINGVGIQWENASARDYTIQVSPDNTTWTIVSTQANLANGARTDTISFPTTSARYVKMNGTARTGTFGYSIYEMNVYSPSAGTPFKLTRRADADDVVGTGATDSGVIKGNWEVRVTRGSANYGHVFRLTSATTPTINVSSLNFTDTGATPMIGGTAPGGMMTPTISPDGKKIAYVTGDADAIGADSAAWRKGLSMVNFDQPTRAVTSKKRLLNNWVAATGGNPVKWPFFESDSRSLVYVQSTPDNFCRDEDVSNDHGRACKESVYGNSAPTSRGHWPGSLYSLDTQAAAPSATAVELSKLNDAENAGDADKSYQPTVLPFASGGYRWVIFTSPRSYGNQINQIGTHFSCGATMLWVSALDDATASTTDRSHPGFFLPGQNVLPITTQDHYLSERGYLVPNQCHTSGLSCNTSDQCCAGTTCRVDTISASGVPNKVCKAAAACGAVGTACLTAADCCGTGALCVADKCAAKPNYAPAGTFTRDFVASCDHGFKPHWGLFEYHLTTPTDSHLAFAAATADSVAKLATATVVALVDSTDDNYGKPLDTVNVGDALVAQKLPFSFFYLRVSMTFNSSSDGAYSPILHDWAQRYSCEPAE